MIQHQPILRLLRYARPHWPQVSLAILASIIYTLLSLAPSLIIGLAVDTIVEQEASLFARLGIQNPLTQLALLSV
ncbi:MAG: ABC transporter, partial [Cyanobacteria bacterium P01_H01_bin.21]